MYKKVYLSRSQTRAMAIEHPIGDPFGGPAYGEKNDPVTAAIVGGATLGGAYLSSQGAKDAANTQAQAGRDAQNQLLATGQRVAPLYQPYQDLGTTSLSSMNANMPYFTNQFSNQDLNANLAPNYAFQLGQGQKANAMASNVLGGANSGNAMTALQDYTQQAAGGAYQNAFNNYQTQRGNIYSTLSNMAGIGLQGTSGAANAQLGVANQVAGITQGIGNAQAGSQIASANAYGGALQNTGNLYALSSLIGKGNGAAVGGDNSLQSLGLNLG